MNATFAIALLLIFTTADAKDNLRKNQAKPTPMNMKGKEAFDHNHRHLKNPVISESQSKSKGGFGACVAECVAEGILTGVECADDCTPSGNNGNKVPMADD